MSSQTTADTGAGSDGRITVERQGQVLLIGIDRVAKRNAFSPTLYDSLGEAYTTLERDDEARCGVLFAHGDHFTAGLDLAQFTPLLAQGINPLELAIGRVDPVNLNGPRRTKPVVVAVQGVCLTLGIELLLASEVRVAAEGTRFAQIEVQRGIYPFGGATMRFQREMGWGNAMRWILTGDFFDAQEALRMGLVQEVVPHGKQLERAVELAERIAAQAPLGVRATLASAWTSVREGEDAAARRLLPNLLPLMSSDDAQEGVQSFVERRAARFTGH